MVAAELAAQCSGGTVAGRVAGTGLLLLDLTLLEA